MSVFGVPRVHCVAFVFSVALALMRHRLMPAAHRMVHVLMRRHRRGGVGVMVALGMIMFMLHFACGLLGALGHHAVLEAFADQLD